MGDVVELPVGAAGGWREIEKYLRALVRFSGFHQSMADWILADLKPRFDAIAVEITIAVDEGDAPAVREMGAQLRKAIGQAAAELLTLEIELYIAKFPDVDAPNPKSPAGWLRGVIEGDALGADRDPQKRNPTGV